MTTIGTYFHRAGAQPVNNLVRDVVLPQPVQIIAQLPITGPDQALTVVVTRRRPLLAMKFRYEPNGNIRELQWKVTRQDVKYYENDYDPINRLLGSNYGIEREVQPAIGAAYIERLNTQDYNEFGIEYDPIGNIKKLSRRGLIPAADCFTPGLIDNLSYSYGDEGRLTAVSDAALDPYRQEGFKPAAGGGPQATHYLYDHNGNLTDDAHKNMQFDYNFLNLPRYITTQQGTLHFLYDATGRKWAKSTSATAPADESGPDGIRFYAGNIEYLDGKIQHIAFPDGRLVAEYGGGGASVTGYRAEYFRTDHLGNTRLTFSDFNQDGVITWKDNPQTLTVSENEITSENHYYPFGLSQKGPWYASVAPGNKYRYNGKEWNDEWGLNMYDYGARGYMPDLGRWGRIDNVSELYYSFSSYSYVVNRPINAIDPDGNLVIFINGFVGTSKSSKGSPSYWRTYEKRMVWDRQPSQWLDPGEYHYEWSQSLSFDGAVMDHLGDHNPLYYHGGTHASAGIRAGHGYQKGLEDADKILDSVVDQNGNVTETIKIITHSMGSAYGKGFVKALLEAAKRRGVKGPLITLVADFDPYQANKLSAEANVFTQQFSQGRKKNGPRVPGAWPYLANKRQDGLQEYYEDPNSASHLIITFINEIRFLKEGTYVWNGSTWVLQE